MDRVQSNSPQRIHAVAPGPPATNSRLPGDRTAATPTLSATSADSTPFSTARARARRWARRE
eukprot:4424746-Pyramimonas_sp.AAC.1